MIIGSVRSLLRFVCFKSVVVSSYAPTRLGQDLCSHLHEELPDVDFLFGSTSIAPKAVGAASLPHHSWSSRVDRRVVKAAGAVRTISAHPYRPLEFAYADVVRDRPNNLQRIWPGSLGRTTRGQLSSGPVGPPTLRWCKPKASSGCRSLTRKISAKSFNLTSGCNNCSWVHQRKHLGESRAPIRGFSRVPKPP